MYIIYKYAKRQNITNIFQYDIYMKLAYFFKKPIPQKTHSHNVSQIQEKQTNSAEVQTQYDSGHKSERLSIDLSHMYFSCIVSNIFGTI